MKSMSQQRKKSKAKKGSQPTKDKCNNNNNNNNNNNTVKRKVDESQIKPIIEKITSKVDDVTTKIEDVTTQIKQADLKSDEPQLNQTVDKPKVEAIVNEVIPKSIDAVVPLKHPLNSKWTLWYYFAEKHKEWEECQHKIHTVDSVEDFWSFVNHLKPPSELTCGVDYSFFKNGIRPAWEDPQNVEGGRLAVASAAKANKIFIDKIWLDVLIYLIGENGPLAEQVNGVVLNARAYGYKVCVWTSTHDENHINAIKLAIRDSLTTPPSKIEFEVHDDQRKKSLHHGRSSSKLF